MMEFIKQKRILYCTMLLLFFMCFILSFMEIAYAAQQKSVGILTFKNISGRRGLDQFITDSLVAELSKNEKFKVIDRVNLGAVLNEQGLSKTGIVAKDSTVQMGRIIGTNYMVTGTILDARIQNPERKSKNKPKVNVTVFWQIIDTTSGTVVFADTLVGSANNSQSIDKNGKKVWSISSGDYMNAVRDAVEKICNSLDEKLNVPSVDAHIAGIDGNMIYLDVGENKKVIPGQVFVVYQEGQSIRHPITGEVLGVQRKAICQITIGNVDRKMASGTVRSGDIYDIRIGDMAIRQ